MGRVSVALALHSGRNCAVSWGASSWQTQLLAPQHEVHFGTKSILFALEWLSVLSSTVTAQRSVPTCLPRATQNIQSAIKSEPNASASRWRSIVAPTGRHLGVQVVGKLNYLRLNVRSTSMPNQSYLHWNSWAC